MCEKMRYQKKQKKLCGEQMLYKNTLIKIKKSLGRYLSLLIIVLVGVGFYAGISASAPDITQVADNYFRSRRLMDLKIVSTMGLTEADAESLRAVAGVSAVYPSCSLNAVSGERAVRLHALEEEVNIPALTLGRLPQKETECVADAETYKIGDVIVLSDAHQEALKHSRFQVVGLAHSPLYLAQDYGSTVVGNGKLSSFLYVPRNSFKMDVYTEIYIKVNTDAAAWSPEYKETAALVEEQLADKKSEREQARYQALQSEAGEEIANAQKELEGQRKKGEDALNQAKAHLEETRTQLVQTRNAVEAYGADAAALAAGFPSGTVFLAQLEEGEAQLKEGEAAYGENSETFLREIKQAEEKLDQARRALAEMERPKWNIAGREGVAGYTQLGSSIDVITSVAAVFPLFFILIVVLMTSNSMARMITEERTEMGTLASLGYKNSKIVGTYLFYVLTATAIGAGAGYFGGCAFIPPLIYKNFLYHLPSLGITYSLPVFFLIFAVAAVVMTGVTLFSCYKAFRQAPAALMRPLPPKQGQKILLERADFFWKRLSFTWKVTLRNMFRYKKRAFMTIVGVTGCSALLVVGFGIRDSMYGVAEKQYGDIFRYDSMVVLKDETTALDSSLAEILKQQGQESPLLLRQAVVKCGEKQESLEAYLLVPGEADLFEKYFSLTDLKTGASIIPKNSGVVITRKLAGAFHLQEGDTLTIKDADNNTFMLTVAAVAENYIGSYLYLTPEGYRNVFGAAPGYNTVVGNFTVNGEAFSKALIDSGQAVNVSLTEDILAAARENSKSIDSIVLLLVAVASLLAVVVLYNLTAINISERIREIATLKVLGFHDRETNGYIYREAAVLTLFSIAAGMGAGVVLHSFVMDVLEQNVDGALRVIHPQSFLISAILTLLFSLIMQGITYFKLKKIDMIESLKSAE